MQILFHLKVQEIEHLKINQILICNDYEILQVLLDLAMLIYRRNQGVESDDLILEERFVGEFDLGQEPVDDGHVLVVDSNLSSEVDTSWRAVSE